MKNKKILLIGIVLVCFAVIIVIAAVSGEKSAADHRRETEKESTESESKEEIITEEGTEKASKKEKNVSEKSQGEESSDSGENDAADSSSGTEENQSQDGETFNAQEQENNPTEGMSGNDADSEKGKSESGNQSDVLPGKIADTGIEVESIGPYDGAFVEDGSDEEVTGVTAILVKNNTGKNIQYAELKFNVPDKGEAVFTFSSIPSDASVMVFEQNRMQYDDSDVYTLTDQTVAYIEEMSKMEDEIGILVQDNNSLTVTNLTGQDKKNVRIFYKYRYEDGVYIGGITFTAKLEEIKAGKSITCSPSHFDSSGCEIMMIGEYDE